MPEPPPSHQPPRSEFNELMRFTFETEGPPHQILAFCHTFFLREPPDSTAAKYGRRGAVSTLNDLASEFEKIYKSPLVDYAELKKMMEPLIGRLRLSLGTATASDTNWRNSHRHILELYASDSCGETKFAIYDSGKLPARIADWDATVAALLKKRKAENEAARLDGVSADGIAPFEAIGYLMRTVFGYSYGRILEHAKIPLAELVKDLERRYDPKDPVVPPRVTCAFERLLKRLEEPLQRAHLKDAGKWEKRYEHLMGRVLGETILENYETSLLPEDISAWVWSIKKAVRNRYLRAPLA